MSRLLRLVACFIFACPMLSAFAQAQNPAPKGHAKHVVGIVLDSNYARIDEFVPRLRQYLVNNVPERMKSVELVAIDSLAADPFAEAKKANCDYLLQMTITASNKPAVGVAIGGESFPDRNGAFTGSDNLDRRILEAVVFRSRLTSIRNDDLDKSENDRVRLGELPTTMDGLSFETTLSRSAERVTLASLKQLPKN